jgi:hypothetical protein
LFLLLFNANLAAETVQVKPYEELQPLKVKENEELPLSEVKEKKVVSENEILADENGSSEEIQLSVSDIPARTVRTDLENVDEAVGYDVLIKPTKKIWSEPFRLRAPAGDPKVRVRLSPGEYSIQTRSLNAINSPGKWSKPQIFWINFRSIANAYPPEGAEIVPKGSISENIIFEWPAVGKANYYLFRLKNENGELIRSAITQQTWISSVVSINSKYSWQVNPMTSKTEWKVLIRKDDKLNFTNFKITTPDVDGRETLVKINKHPKAVKYQFEVVSVAENDVTGEPSIVDSYEPTVRLRFPPGEYEMRARNVYSDHSVSQWSAPSRFFIKQFMPRKIYPEIATKIDPTDNVKAQVPLKWTTDSKNAFFRVFVFDLEGNLVFSKRTKETEVMAEVPHNQMYRWTVRAYSSREPASGMVNPDDPDFIGFSVAEYTPLSLASGEESSQLYGWAKHISSIEDYSSNNFEENARVKQTIFGGEGEGAIGYWSRKLRVGLLAHASLAGLIYEGQNYNYANYGVHVGKRFLLDNGDRLRVWLGVTYREMPEVITNPFTSKVVYSRISSLGPQLQTQYIRPLSDKWGLNFMGSVYLSQQSQGTPNGADQLQRASFRLSALASYNKSKELRYLAGYTYRLEESAYQSVDVPTEINSAKISGHYFSFMIEWSLADKQK